MVMMASLVYYSLYIGIFYEAKRYQSQGQPTPHTNGHKRSKDQPFIHLTTSQTIVRPDRKARRPKIAKH